MSAETPNVRQVKGYCGLCIARCGTVATLTDGRFTRLDPDPTHPTGAAICAKGRAAPELVYHKNRLKRPLRRTRPKGDTDPGWEEISWDAALDQTAAAMRRIAEQHGPGAVAFSQPSSSTTAIADSTAYIRRLMNAFGTPNLVYAFDLCGWGRAIATRYVFGVGTVGVASGGAMPDIAESGCLILWGYNPSFSRITHATATVAGLKRGMKLIVIDPRNVGLANKADVWLRVRPGTDGALALGLANIMIERGWYDQEFVREWSNGPFLVRSDTGRLLKANELASGGGSDQFVAWDFLVNRAVRYDPTEGRYEAPTKDLALRGEYTVATMHGSLRCRPAFDHYATLCKTYSPDVIERTCWIPPSQLEQAAHTIWHARPVSYYAWSGHEHHANATETARAMAMFYALTGSFDVPGGNVLLPAVPAGSITGEDLPAARRLVPAIGLVERPLGPARLNNVSARDFYGAVLEGTPYPVRGLIGFGNNLLLAQGDPVRGRAALAALDFYVHADLFMTPTAALADIVLPVASCFEREALKIGFEISADAQSHVQLRQAIVEPQGEARSDTDIVFGLATRLGLDEQFWDGNVDASYRQQLGPSGITLEQLRAEPAGLRKPLAMRYRKHAGSDSKGNPRGFPTPSRKIEFWSETFLDHGYSAMPDFVEPPIGPVASPDLAAAFPLILTCAKPSLFCQTQHRALPSLRRRALHPEIELNPATAAARGINNGDWVEVRTPAGAMRARARFSDQLDPRVVVGEHGWWQGCDELGITDSDPFAANGTNFNLTVDAAVRDPVSGTPAHRSNLCEIRPVLAAR
ncbi:molybdopterin-dependent oxidoreductase [Bradyrhizobium jicamae]|uniref:molybdopterin-containing oxidoreductase family protein n=1 Tax=Bradyrhizobium jicamae TaxID=280332 RepID=UPI001BA5E2AD|nr:molybdopterin-dependent oxidoreductase [Bradyrhizobium jicamae]MBR0939066.1 molybdopterin-dependent oxidoreductase [Bradyrhizobium jicamae]